MGFRRYISLSCICVGFAINLINYNRDGTFLIILSTVPSFKFMSLSIKIFGPTLRTESGQDNFSNIRA